MRLGPPLEFAPDDLDAEHLYFGDAEIPEHQRADPGGAQPTSAEINDLIEVCFDLAEIHGVSGREAVAVITKTLRKRVAFERLKRKHDVRHAHDGTRQRDTTGRDRNDL